MTYPVLNISLVSLSYLLKQLIPKFKFDLNQY